MCVLEYTSLDIAVVEITLKAICIRHVNECKVIVFELAFEELAFVEVSLRHIKIREIKVKYRVSCVT